ncbi:hypothetical protein AX16_007307 [Volvariella volvacea WC 439]|nr:hypothetical protein AX16_007307 [Volvariella volvacea WC 439]
MFPALMANHDGALAAHVRQLLFQYALTHLTTDYIAFTEDLVAQLLSPALKEIPTTDPNAIFLPTNPFQRFARIHSLSLDQPDVALEQSTKIIENSCRCLTTKESLAFIRNVLNVKGMCKSESIALDDLDDGACEPLRPMSPILTLKAQLHTKQLGRGSFRNSVVMRAAELSKLLISVEPEQPLFDQNSEFFQWRAQLTPAEVLESKSYREGIAALLRPKHKWNPPHMKFLTRKRYSEDALLMRTDTFSSNLEPFTPIFSRTDRPASMGGALCAAYRPQSLSDLPAKMLPIVIKVVDEDDEDLYLKNMQAVNGLESYITSPISSLSAPSSSQDQLVRALRTSSPDTEPLDIQILERAKDDVLVPIVSRISQPGHGTIPLASFLLPLIKPSTSTEHSSTLELTIDSASTTIRPSSDPTSPSDPSVEDIDDLISSKFCCHSAIINGSAIQLIDPGKPPFESNVSTYGQLDRHSEDTISITFMDVPCLPPPNAQKSTGIPTSLRDFLSPLPSKDLSSIPIRPTSKQFLKKVKGIQSLNVSLSWLPFSTRMKMPVHTDIAGVTELFGLRNDAEYLAVQDIVRSLTTERRDKPISGISTGTMDNGPWIRGFMTELRDNETGGGDIGSLVDELGRGEISFTKSERQKGRSCGTVQPSSQRVGNHEEIGEITELRQDYGESSTQNSVDEKVNGDSPAGWDKNNDENYSMTIRHIDAISHSANTPQYPEVIARPDLELSSSFTLGEFTSCEIDELPTLTSDFDVSFLEPIIDTDGLYSDWGSPPFAPAFDQFAHLNAARPSEFLLDTPTDNYANQTSVCFRANGRLDYSEHLYGKRGLGGYVDKSCDIVGQTSVATMDDADDSKKTEPGAIRSPENHPQVCKTLGDSNVPGADFDSSRSELDISNDISLINRSMDSLTFARLRARTIASATPLNQPFLDKIGGSMPATITEAQRRSPGPPDSLVDSHTVKLAVVDNDQDTIRNNHKYLASLQVIQARGLMAAITCPWHKITLIEREILFPRNLDNATMFSDVSLILDPFTAIIFASLFCLSARGAELVSLVSQMSWKFEDILIVFEAFPENAAQSRGNAQAAPSHNVHNPLNTPYAYTPPIIKATQKFKRDLAIAEAFGTKRAGEAARVRYAFADSAGDVARLCRWFGDEAESIASQRVKKMLERYGSGEDEEEFSAISQWLWGEREWLRDDLDDREEEILASAEGFNRFAASAILSHSSLQNFLDLTAQERIYQFGLLVGVETIEMFNDSLERMQVCPE